MFEKLVKIHVLQSLGFFVAAYASAFLGCIWLGMTVSGYQPLTFEFAPSFVFLTISFLVLVKGYLVVLNRPLCEPESTLFMTLPVSEATLVWSKVFVAVLGGFLFYLILGYQWIYWLSMGHGIDTQMTLLATVFIDLDFSAWAASLSIGLVPILLALELVVVCLLMLLTTLVLRNRRPMQKLIGPAYLLWVMLQLGFNLWLVKNYEAFIGHLHPLALDCGLLVIFVGLSLLLYRNCLKHLRYKYED